MARKETEDFDLDDFNLDNFDFGDPFMEPDSPKDDRSPVTKVGKGFLEGVKQTAKSPSFYINSMRQALPDGYGAAYDLIDDAANQGLGLYNEVVQDLRPSLRDLKRIMFRANNTVDAVIPDRLSKKLDEWLKDRDNSSDRATLADMDPQTAAISRDLAEIFQQQAEEKHEERTQDLVKQTVEGKRFEARSDQIEEIRRNIGRMVGYQDNITAKYQQKSLELQYRHYFVARDLLELNKAAVADHTTLLQNIQKNTALPEAQKVKMSEQASIMVRERLIGAAQDRFSNYSRDFINKFMGNIGKRIKETTDEFKDAVAMAAFASESMDMEGMEELGISAEGMAGEMAGQTTTRWLGEKLGKLLKPFVEKNPGIMDTGQRLSYGTENIQGIVKDYFEDQFYTNPIMQIIQESALDAARIRRDTRVGYDEIAKATEAVHWDNLSRKSLVEIIPGYLARILQATSKITEDGSGLVVYDHETNQFMGQDTLVQRLRKGSIDQYSMDTLRDITQDMVDKLGAKDELGDDVSKKLESFLLKQARHQRHFTPKDYLDPFNLIRDGFSAEEASQISDLMTERLGLDFDGKMQRGNVKGSKLLLDLARSQQRLRESLPSTSEFANIHANTGNREAVRLAGLTRSVQGRDHIDDSYLYQRFEQTLRGEKPDETPAAQDPSSSPVDFRSTAFTDRTASQRLSAEQVIEISDALRVSNMESMREALRGVREETAIAGLTDDDKSFYLSQTDRLTQTIQESSSRESSEEAFGVLQEILGCLQSIKEEGLFRADGSDGSASGRRGMLNRMWGLGKSTFKPLWDLGGSVQSGAMGAIRGSWNIGTGALGKMFGRGKASVKERFKDVHVPGFKLPKLTAQKMMQGHYVDAITGKVIESVEDIKGAVKDIELDQVVLTAEDYAKGLYDSAGKKLVEVEGGLFDLMKKAGGLVTGEFKKGFALPGQVLRGSLDFAKKIFKTYPDVYVGSESTPRLIGQVMMRGGYFSGKTGKVLTSVFDIDGDVKDANGNTILSLQEMRQGLFDKAGKPFKSLMGKATELVKSTFGLGMRAARWGVGQLKKGFGDVGSILTAGKNFVTGRFGSSGAGADTKPATEAIDRIYDLLVRYFKSKGMDLDDLDAEIASRTGTSADEFVGPKRPEGPSAAKAEEVDESSEKEAKVQTGFMALLSRAFGIPIGDLTSKLKESAGLGERTKGVRDSISAKADSMRERAGSWKNILEARRNKSTEGDKGPTVVVQADDRKDGVFGKILSVLGIIAGKAVGMVKALAGIWTAVKGFALGKGLLGAGAAAGAAKAGGAAAGAGAATAKRGLLRRAAGGAVRGAWGLTKGVAKGAWWIGRGALALVGGKVALAAGVVAGLAWGGYKAYQYFKKRPDPLQRVRMTQYGVPIATKNHDMYVTIGELEQRVMPNVKFNKGEPDLDYNGLNFEELVGLFGVDKNSHKEVQPWARWFKERFTPVFLSHIGMIRKLHRSAKIETVDSDMPDYLKIEYAKGTRYSEADYGYPYDVTDSPFPGRSLNGGYRDIDDAILRVERKFRKARAPSEAQERVAEAVIETSEERRDERTSAPERAQEAIEATRQERPTAPTMQESYVNTASFERDRVDRADVYRSIPNPTGSGNWDAVRDTILKVAELTGTDPKLLEMLARIESGFNPNAKDDVGSRSGLFMFDQSTWRALLERFGHLYDIPLSTKPTDARAAALMAAEYIKQNQSIMRQRLGHEPTERDIYAKHLLGPSDSARLLRAAGDAIAADMMPERARANRDLFYAEGRAKTVAELLTTLESRLRSPGSVRQQIDIESGRMRVVDARPDVIPDAQVTRPDVVEVRAAAIERTANEQAREEQRSVTREQTSSIREMKQRQVEEYQLTHAELQTNKLTSTVEFLRMSYDTQTRMADYLKHISTHVQYLADVTEAKLEDVLDAPSRPSVTASTTAPTRRTTANRGAIPMKRTIR